MKNLTTNTQKGLGFGTTTRITKTFTTTVNNKELKLSVYRNEDSAFKFKSKSYYTLEYKGQELGSNMMGKSQLKWQLDFIHSGKFDEIYS